MNAPDSSTSLKRASSCARSGAYCAWTSTSGIFCTAGHSSCASASVQEVAQQRRDAGRDRVLDVLEAVIEPLVAAAEAVAGPGDRERPDRGPDQRQQRVRREGHLEDAGGDRDEGADDRRHAADEHAQVSPAAEPLL